MKTIDIFPPIHAEGEPARQDHQYIRGKTYKLLTLFRPSSGELRAEPVDASPNALLHPWLKRELEALLKQCPAAPEVVPEGRYWHVWDPFPAAGQLDRFFPPLRMLRILDNLAGHYSRDFVNWGHQRGIGLLYTPCAGSWLNMAESVQHIIIRWALEGHHIYDVEILVILISIQIRICFCSIVLALFLCYKLLGRPTHFQAMGIWLIATA